VINCSGRLNWWTNLERVLAERVEDVLGCPRRMQRARIVSVDSHGGF
jgi:hypothetical protein